MRNEVHNVYGVLAFVWKPEKGQLETGVGGWGLRRPEQYSWSMMVSLTRGQALRLQE